MTAEDGSKLNEQLRALPQVDAVLSAGMGSGAFTPYARDVVKRMVQGELSAWREFIKAGKAGQPPDAGELAHAVAGRLARLATPQLMPVVNASGILLHTNLGRAVLPACAQAALQAVAGAYSNLELDLATGQRSHRDVHLEPLLQALTGCEAATVVNNNAAAVFLTLNTLATGGEVICSRGELIEIGGSFRIPDIMRAARCKLVEVGTTNRTRLSDYAQAISSKAMLLLKTHPSNYRIRGFTEEVELAELSALAHDEGLPVYYDIGSGYLARPGLPDLPEPEVVAALQAGADIVSFSGDKLLGGPQAGILIGKRELITRIRKNALWRMVRIDKLTAAALEAVLAQRLLAPDSGWVAEPAVQAAELAQALISAMPGLEVVVEEADGYYGGGSLPDEALTSAVVLVRHPAMGPDVLDKALRLGKPPVVGVIHRGVYGLNVLALLPGDVERITRAFQELLHG